jgi:hypothetical protein
VAHFGPRCHHTVSTWNLVLDAARSSPSPVPYYVLCCFIRVYPSILRFSAFLAPTTRPIYNLIGHHLLA